MNLTVHYLAINRLTQFLQSHENSHQPPTPCILTGARTSIIPGGADLTHVRDRPKQDQANLL